MVRTSHHCLNHALPDEGLTSSPSTPTASPPLPPLCPSLPTMPPVILTANVIPKQASTLTPTNPTQTRLLPLYFSPPTSPLESASHPVYNAYVVTILPRLPNPLTRAVAAATPTSPWRAEKISLVQVMVTGTVGPRPKPMIKRPP